MADYYYNDAQRLGQKNSKLYTSQNLDPKLPALDELVSSDRLSSGKNIGLILIPSELIIGTKTASRADVFAPNFMPLPEFNTEFAIKWEALCNAHLTEGIRDPVKAYEFKNRYYIEEGNKRVSVLKFFGAVNIPGNVITIAAQKDDFPDEKSFLLYKELQEFISLSKIRYLEFSEPGSYASLQSAVGKRPAESWTEEERRHFNSVWHFFCKTYASVAGTKLNSSAADAILSYIQIYGYAALGKATESEIKKNLAGMWEEVEIKGESNPVELNLKPSDEKKKSLLASVFHAASAPEKAAFVYDKNPETSGWTLGHELGRKYVQEVLGKEIETCAYPDAMRSNPDEVLEKAIADGNRIIFTASPRLLKSSLRIAVRHPEVTILNCSLNQSHRYVRSYYARMYEAKFIIGAVAGSLSESGRLGYVCDYPIYGQIAGINAFTLGAQMTNPRAKVYLEWTSVKGATSESAAEKLAAMGIHYISTHDIAKLANGERSSFGLSLFSENGSELLAMPVWNWGVYYERILREMKNRSAQTEYEESGKALNYYWGMSAGVIDLVYPGTLRGGTRRLADFLKKSFAQGVANPFITPLHTKDGGLIGEGQEELSIEQIVSMDYLVEGVIGEIPKYTDLNTLGKATVEISGVDTAASAGRL